MNKIIVKKLPETFIIQHNNKLFQTVTYNLTPYIWF